MARIETMDDFRKITSNITSFSHAYLFNVNSLIEVYPFVKDFAKQIILGKNTDELTSFQIDNEEYDDLYIVNPSTIGINNEEISKLLSYMQTKSLRPNGKRVYIIYGFERLTRDISNKILKFLEEPNDDIYALLMTENFEKILPTIVSRCQVINLFIPTENNDEKIVENLKEFLDLILKNGKKTIAYVQDYFADALQDRNVFYKYFEILEKMISETLNNKYLNESIENIYICGNILAYSNNQIINALNITNQLKCLIKGNINLNLLLDRYIIEITEEFGICKK